MTKYRIKAAYLQLGDKPPYNCVHTPAHMDGDDYMIKIGRKFERIHPGKSLVHENLPVKSVWGQHLAGIALDFEIDDTPETDQ